MAGKSKPDIEGLLGEAKYVINDMMASQGSGGTKDNCGLFNGVQINEWSSPNVFYWQYSTNYLDITIYNNCNIYRSGTTEWASAISRLKIEKYENDTWIDISSSIIQNLTPINETKWELYITDLKKGRYKFIGTGARIDSEWYIESTDIYLLKRDNKYYSIKEKYYNTTSKVYNEITDLTADNFNSYGFPIEYLFNETIIESETFKPIDKFEKFQIVYPNIMENTNIQGIKYKKAMTIANGDFSLKLVENIDFFDSEASIGNDCSIKVVFSKDGGMTWQTTNDNGIIWTSLINTVPMKKYSELTIEEKTQWVILMDEISDYGIDLSDLNNIDFNTLEADKLRLAYVFNINNTNDINIINKLLWQFDSIGSYEQMNNDSDVNISITNNAIKIKPLKNYNLMKINVGISSDKDMVDINISKFATKDDLKGIENLSTHKNRDVLDLLSTDGTDLFFKGKKISFTVD